MYDNECDGECNICGFARKAPHKYEWSYNEEMHWNVCECGNTDCPPIEHVFEDGVCSECGAMQAGVSDTTKPTSPDADIDIDIDEKLGGISTVIFSVLAIVAVIICGTLAIVFVGKKKNGKKEE